MPASPTVVKKPGPARGRPDPNAPMTVPAATAAERSLVSPRMAYALLALVVVLWGVNWPIMKLGLQAIPPMTFAATRVVLAAACFLALAALRGRLRPPSRQDWPVVLSVGLINMAAFLGLVTIALQFVPAGRSAILAYTTPLWVVPGALLFLGERLTRARLAGLTLGMLGIAVLFNPFGFDWHDRTVLVGNGLLLLAALAWAAQIVHVRGQRWQASPLDLAPWQALIACLVLVPVAAVLEGDQAVRWSREVVAILGYSGPVATALCLWALVTVNRALPAITVSLGLLGAPVVGMLSSVWLLGEALSATNLGGLTLIGAGLVILNLSERPRPLA